MSPNEGFIVFIDYWGLARSFYESWGDWVDPGEIVRLAMRLIFYIFLQGFTKSTSSMERNILANINICQPIEEHFNQL